MSKEREELKLALEYLRDNQHYIADNERHVYVMEYNAFVERLEALVEQPIPKWQGVRFDSALHDQPAQHPDEFKCPLCYDDPANIKPSQQQEPVAWANERAIQWLHDRGPTASITTTISKIKSFERPLPFYTSPQPSKPWVGLTDEDWPLSPVCWTEDYKAGVAWAEAKLKEKNAQPSKPLTGEQINLIMDGRGEEGDDNYVKPAFDPFGISEDDLMNFARAIEAAHGIKGDA